MIQGVWTVLLICLWVLGLFLVFTFLLPRTVSVRRQVLVDAPPRAVFPLLNEARNWSRWLPWEQPGGRASAAYEGPEAGEGATRKWKGASGATGHQVLVETDPPNYLRMSLDTGRYGPGRAEWSIEADDDSLCRVTCVLDLDVGTSIRRRWEGIFLRGQVAEEVEEGLQSLKEVAEASTEARSNGAVQ